MTQIIYGRHPVVAALRQPDTPWKRSSWPRGRGGSGSMRLSGWPGPRGCACRVPERAALDRLCGTPHHQGILARRGSYVYRGLGELLDDLAG